MKSHSDLKLQHRDIVFSALPTDQAVQAARLLGRIVGVTVQAYPSEHRVSVQYSVSEHTLLKLETILMDAGFHLDNHILQKIKRALAHYCEEVQCDNLNIPEHNIKSRDVYAKVWEKHPHGDHDETPEELRRYL
ncbi:MULTISPECIES: hypothetical protein [Deefgea]|uniref:Cation transporter n=1 Tax=Deefgea chitinilytica TaxID=570276 RepID=A0ABS2CD27_9NEIS|nr:MULTISPECIES: hypothetical protein [Deefgea]MBM5572030.1 hypothetical protein [Deefgea chitinilytica]MBM9889265.1 hypothetical protein [Deefgea sp. CFH1-16]